MRLALSFLKRLVPLKGKVSITFDKPGFQEGEDVVGKVNVESNEKHIQAEEVRVEARALEHYKELEWVSRGNNQRVQEWVNKKSTLFERVVRVSGPTDFGVGPRNFPFAASIPPYRPTKYAGSIEYSIKAVVGVKGRPDLVGETNVSFVPPAPMTVVVAGAMPGQMPVQPVAPVGPQVVKVRCRHCNYLMDVTAAQCPNCGAKQ